MNRSHHVSHVTFYNSSYVVLFCDGTYSTQGLSTLLFNQMKYAKSKIEFISLGPYQQWFYRLENGKVFYKIHDNYINELLGNSTLQPYKIWFNGNNGYVLQFDDFNVIWKTIPDDLQTTLKNRSKSSSKVQNLAFGPNNTWWISYLDNNSSWSSHLPSYIKQHLNKTKLLVLDPMTYHNYFIFQNNGLLIWHGNYHFNRLINDKKDTDICFLNPKNIRYTQTTISHQFSTGQYISQLRDELESGSTTIDEIPAIDVIQTRSGNLWSLNNRRLWCFRNASTIDEIPVRIVKQRPSWLDSRMKKLKNPFNIHVRHSPEPNENDSDSDFEYELDSDGGIALTFENYMRIFSDL